MAMHDLAKSLDLVVLPDGTTQNLVFEVDGGIPSADAAATIKFGIEELPGAAKVRFIESGVEVIRGQEGSSVETMLEIFAKAGLGKDQVRSR